MTAQLYVISPVKGDKIFLRQRLTFSFVPLTLSFAPFGRPSPWKVSIGTGPDLPIRIGALLCLLTDSQHERRLCNLFLHRLPLRIAIRHQIHQDKTGQSPMNTLLRRGNGRIARAPTGKK